MLARTHVIIAGATWAAAWHLLADAATPRGIPLFLPLSRVRLRLPGPLAVRTGGPGEVLYLIVITALAAIHATGELW
ncbi:MAG: metal-dependent hydrolase [Chloroflexi bacterium]|nr:metal-dependent hydrolase [Chloroflexota bacterium]